MAISAIDAHTGVAGPQADRCRECGWRIGASNTRNQAQNQAQSQTRGVNGLWGNVNKYAGDAAPVGFHFRSCLRVSDMDFRIKIV
jgi:hypothetical protein